jgi:hypothetical protein
MVIARRTLHDATGLNHSVGIETNRSRTYDAIETESRVARIFGKPDLQMKAVNVEKIAAIPAQVTYHPSLSGLHPMSFPVIKIITSWTANTARESIVAASPTAINVMPGSPSIHFFLM